MTRYDAVATLLLVALDLGLLYALLRLWTGRDPVGPFPRSRPTPATRLIGNLIWTLIIGLIVFGSVRVVLQKIR